MGRLVLLFSLSAGALLAQRVPSSLDIDGRLDASNALWTSPIRLVTTLPETCIYGQSVYLTTAPLTKWLHVCTSTNTWTQQGVTQLPWGSIVDKPATFPPSVHSHLAVDLPATVLYSTGTYSNPAWLASLAGEKISGPVPAAEALAQDGTDCPTGQASRGIDTQGNATGCFVPDGGGGEGGTVTSIGLSAPAQFTVLGSPITASGILTMDWLPQNANTVLAGPTSGSPAAPGFRSLTAQDLPGTVLHSTGSYVNPAWLSSLDWSKISNRPLWMQYALLVGHTTSPNSLPSGFYQASEPDSNWPAGATSWWHLLTTRHNNPENNYAMQFAGSFFDQRFWARKTNGSDTTPWSEILTTALPAQINFGFGGDPATVIPNTTFNNVWRAHAHSATVTEVACWTDAGTVSLTIRRSDGTNMHSALTCSATGASTSTITTPGVAMGQGLGFVTASASTVKNLSVSIKYTRSY
ncbi:MAG: hypothetical protein KJZ84_23915 [Bryobacteraceae bacterium]|nr:hypothetical protein [Bryobacteraceae bacterium]